MACSGKVDQSKKEKKMPSFPIIISTLQTRSLDIASEKYLCTGDHYAYYFGKISDTIQIGHSILPYDGSLPPPPPNEKDTASKKRILLL